MAPLLVLVVFTGIARLIGLFGVAALDSWSLATSIGLAAMFLLTGITHFVQPRRDGYIAIVPPQFPNPALIVTLSGILELVGALGLLVPATRDAAAICLALLLVVVFPANVYAAGEQRHPAAPRTPLLPRTLMQLVFLAACAVVVFA